VDAPKHRHLGGIEGLKRYQAAVRVQGWSACFIQDPEFNSQHQSPVFHFQSCQLCCVPLVNDCPFLALVLFKSGMGLSCGQQGLGPMEGRGGQLSVLLPPSFKCLGAEEGMQYAHTCVAHLCCHSGEWTGKEGGGLKGATEKPAHANLCVICFYVAKEKTPEP